MNLTNNSALENPFDDTYFNPASSIEVRKTGEENRIHRLVEQLPIKQVWLTFIFQSASIDI